MHIAPNVQLAGRVLPLSNGAAGTYETLRYMRRLADDASVDPSIITRAVQCIFLTPARNDWAEVSALFNMVRDSIRYTRDVLNVETLSSPQMTLARRVGDCDDMSTLLAALVQAVGYPSRFIAVGFHSENSFEHVYCEVFINGEWIACDPTEPFPMGWAPPDPITTYIERE